MELTAKSLPNGSFLYCKLKWFKINFPLNQNIFKYNTYDGNYQYLCELELEDNARISILKGQIIGDSEFKLQLINNDQIEVHFKKENIRPSGLNAYREVKEIEGVLFKLKIVIDNKRKSSPKKKKINRNLINNPYPIRIFSGGGCSPK